MGGSKRMNNTKWLRNNWWRVVITLVFLALAIIHTYQINTK